MIHNVMYGISSMSQVYPACIHTDNDLHDTNNKLPLLTLGFRMVLLIPPEMANIEYPLLEAKSSTSTSYKQF